MTFNALDAQDSDAAAEIAPALQGRGEIIQIDGHADAVVEIGGPRKPLRRKTSPKGVTAMARSAVSNKPNLIPNADQRLAWCRRERDLIAECLAALGGIENTSVQEQWIIRTAATIKVITEKLEAKFATAGDFTDTDADMYQRCANSLRRALESIGLQRRALDVSANSLQDKLKIIAAEEMPT